MRLKDCKKTSSFTSKLTPDPDVPTVSIAKDPSTPDVLFHKARQLRGGAFTWLKPEIRKEYKFLAASDKAIQDLGLDPKFEMSSDYFQRITSGQKIVEDPFPYAQAYAGYQFGSFAGQLGDGRVVNLFEITNDSGKRYEIQLKGSGKTPFSRFADGKAVLRSSIREFIISESLNAIGIPSTRALAITALPRTLAQRNGAETCAVVCRMSPSWIRVGTFDLYSYRGDMKGLFDLSNYVIDEVFHGEQNLCQDDHLLEDPSIKKLGKLSKYDKMYFEIVTRNAKAVARWQAYGFLNGVLNTDNTSILGLAMDFGPFAFMDYFDQNYTSNSEDISLRYSFRNMPSAIWFNMVKLAEDLVQIIGAGPDLLNDSSFKVSELDDEWVKMLAKRTNQIVSTASEIYETTYINYYLKLVCKRLGITQKPTDHLGILSMLFDTLEYTKLDYTSFFVILERLPILSDKFDLDKAALSFIPSNFKDDPFTNYSKENVIKQLKVFLKQFKERIQQENISDSDRFTKASKVNPLFVPKNWIFDEVIQYTQDHNMDSRYIKKLLAMSCNPYNKEKWGTDLKDIEARWLQPTEKKKLMSQCGCSS